jgi:hypothetical protein
VIVIELLEAVIKLGLPVFGVSWWAIHRLYKKGDITPGADHRTVKSDLKAFRKKWRKNKGTEHDLMENKWMRFGGGFYGITALTTFILIELGEVIGFFQNLSAIGDLFNNGVIALVVDILVGQIRNFISALIWFTYWADEDRSIFIWIGVAYASYLLGIFRATNYHIEGQELDDEEEIENKIESDAD